MNERNAARTIPEHIQKIIQENDVDVLIKRAQILAQSLEGKDLTNTQIRNVYASVKQIVNSNEPHDDKNVRRIKMLLPRLHYAAKKTEALKDLAEELSHCIQALGPQSDANYDKRFQRFADYLEAIVAYHYKPSRDY